MIKTIRHTGIVVRDLDQSLNFYQKLGFHLWKREIESGGFIDQVVGILKVQIETAKLKLGDGSMIELLEYKSHPLNNPIENSCSNRLGCSHLAFTVKDIDEICNHIKTNGGNLVNPPALSPNGAVMVAYAHDIEGNLLELVQEL